MWRLLLVLMILALRPGFAFAADPLADAKASNQEADSRYKNAITEARAGHLEPALATLNSLVSRYPARQDILNDYAVVLGWAGDHAAALALLDKIDRPRAPAYVLEGVAGSARHLQRYDEAESLYRESSQRFPERLEPQIGLALTLADAGRLDEAAELIKQLYARYPRRIDVLEALAYISTARGDHFAALAAYQAILGLEPGHRGALRGKIHTLGALGTPQLALDLGDRNPDILEVQEREALAADLTAHRIRWGAITADSSPGPSRFAGTDRALADSEIAGQRALDRNTALTKTERQLALDRITALRDRFRMQDAIDLYEAMAGRPEAMPAYVKSAAASAYLYIQQPQKSRDLYREALAIEPNNLNARIGLFFALAENEEHKAALKEIEDAVAITPQWIDAWSPATIRENPAYARVLSARAMAPLFANRPGEAEKRLHELSDRAPYHMDIRTDYASSMRARGWPRKATEELRWILEIEPENSGALGEHAGALLEMRDYRNAEAALGLAQATAAEDGRVVRAGRLWEVHNMRELVVDGTYGRSNGGPAGNEDYAVDARLYTSPIDYDYRVFAHTHTAAAKFDTGSGRHNRAGIGVEYRSPLYMATTEIFQDIEEDEPGAAASLAITPNDYWTFRGRVDTSATETPLQARFAGVNAWLASAEAVWQAHESRSAALSYTHMEFDDDNRRDITQARWTERVVSGPVYKLEVTGGLYASRNSLDGAPYFNPSSDFSPTLEFANEWLQWRRYTRAFRHRLVAAVGSYWQEDFGTGSVYNVRYEQEWAADDRLVLRYGLGHGRHPYDGEDTTRNYGYFYLNWRF